jgi:uncharacterized protein (DUF488 family)
MRIHTIGHSTRELGELIALLQENGVGRLADIRRHPGSRRYPHFSSQSLAAALPERGIAYIHMPELGGRRKPATDSPNTFWRNEQFRGYADHMGTEEFREAVDRLLGFSEATAILCAEAVPWRCHRNLVADDLVRRGVQVVHILGAGSLKEHAMNEHAHVDADRMTYPASYNLVLIP